jgi:microcystin-dependent protein
MAQQLDPPPYIGDIALFAFNFAPSGWALCQGQLLAIAQNTALFAILGTTYGGNGKTTFALPDLRGRVPLHVGDSQGPGLSSHDLGEVAGEETSTVFINQMPAHTHAPRCVDAVGDDFGPAGVVWAEDAGGNPQYGTTKSATVAFTALKTAGGSQPHNNMAPYLTLNYCIALEGAFPPHN